MNRTIFATACAAIALAAAPTLAACTSTSGTPTTASGSSAPATPRSVADGFMNAYAQGDLAVACSFTSGKQLADMTQAGECVGQGNWAPQTPREFKSCSTAGGSMEFGYNVDQPVNRFLTFAVYVGLVNDKWSVTGLGKGSPGMDSPVTCTTPTSSGPTSSAG